MRHFVPKMIILALTALTGCAGQAANVRPPVALCPSPRPALVVDDRITTEGEQWLAACLHAQYQNCVVLQTLRGENVATCAEAFR